MMLLVLDRVSVVFRTARGPLHALDNVSFGIEAGQSLGVVGESGCGKTTLARTILRLLPANADHPSGRILFRGDDLLAMRMPQVRDVRWRGIALVTQSAMNALDPVYRVGDQIAEAIRTHESCSAGETRERVVRLLETVGLSPDLRRRYPHELSGGMRQRAIIAMALALDPPLIIADEPTTALDVIMQDQVFAELARIRARGTTLVLITHDISLVAENCDLAAVMYAGQIVEYGPAQEVLAAPLHPYTIGLRNAFADLEDGERALISIAGTPPDLVAPPVGCRFAPRCPFARDKCRAEPPQPARERGHWAACHFTDEAERFRRLARDADTWETAPAAVIAS